MLLSRMPAGIGTVENQVADAALKWSQYLCPNWSDGDDITVSNSAEPFDVNRRLDIEDHPGFERLRGFGMKARARIVRNGGKADAMPGGVADFLAETMRGQDFTCGAINIGSIGSGTNRLECGSARLQHRIVHTLFFFIDARKR